MPECVIDASALLALLNAEPGADVVIEALPGGVISAVNLSEVIAKLCSAGLPKEAVDKVLGPLDLQVEPFDEQQAYEAGLLRPATVNAGLSLGDRACLSLARKLGVEALTADKAWAELSIGTVIRIIR